MQAITPELITLVLNILIILGIGICFLIGFCRGIYKATFRFVVSIVVIFGCWLLFPLITAKIMDFDFSGIYNLNYEGYEIHSINEGLDFATKFLLGLIKPMEGGGFTPYTSDVVISETLLYGLLTGLVEMLFRIVLIIIVLILNWTLFRIIFGIVYLCTKPKKRDKFNKKKKTVSNRLIGGAIGFVNGIFILLLVCAPLSGIMSVADNAADLMQGVETSDQVKLSLGSEVINLSGENIENISIGNLKPWTSIYRKTVGGFIFQIKVSDDTEMDCAIFDSTFKFKANGDSVAIRKEIDTCADAAKVLKDKIITPLVNEETFTPEILDNLSSQDITNVFNELKDLKIVNVVVPIGVEVGIYNVKNDPKLNEQYADIVDLFENVDPQEINVSDTIIQIGNLSSSLFELVEASGQKISDLIGGDTSTPSKYIDALLQVDSETVTKVFNSIADIELIDKLQSIAFVPLQDYLENTEEFDEFILLYPKIEVSEDGYYLINGVKSQIQVIPDKELTSLSIKINSKNNWIIEDIETEISAEGSIFKLNLENIKLTDEIRNFGSLYTAFKAFGVSSFSEVQKLIEAGPDAEGSYDLSKVTYDKVDNLFKSLLNFKTISNHTDNLYVVINNIVPMEYRGLIKSSKLTSEDLSSLVYAAKLVASTGIVWDTENKINTDGKIDYTKIHNLFTGIKDELAENITKSSIVCSNINAVCEYALKQFLPELTLDLECVDWDNDGGTELKKLFNVADEVLKYGNKLMNDFYSLTDEELDEICEVIKANISTSKLLKNNMNNLVDMVSKTEQFKELGITLTTIDNKDWTSDELDSIFDTLKVVVKVMKSSGGTEEKNLIVEILKLTQEDIDILLSSEFIVKNLAYNLVELSKEGGLLYQKVIVNLDKDDPRWFDQIENGEVKTPGELRIILTNAIKLINGIENFDDMDLLIEKAILNVSNLSNNFKGEDDEVGELLSSVILSDTIIYHIEHLSDYLPDETKDIIVIDDSIVWKDTETTAGELRIILKAITNLLVDDEGNVLYSKLKSANLNDIADIFFKVNDEKIEYVLASKIVLDTAVKFIKKYSEPEDGRTFTIFLKNPNLDDSEWRIELKKMIKGAKIVLYDKNGELIDLNGGEEQYINIIAGIKDDDVSIITASDILVDTLANLIIDLADEEGSLFKVSSNYRKVDKWTDELTVKWRSEIAKIIKAARVILFDKDGKSVYADLTGSDTNKKLEIIINIDDTDIQTVVASDIVVDTISNIIIDMSTEENAFIKISDDVLAYDTIAWREEINKIIISAKHLLVTEDEFGNKTTNIDKITSQNTNDILDIVINIKDEQIADILDSKVIVDTISKVIIDLASQAGSVIKISDEVIDYSRSQWETELSALIKSARNLLTYTDGTGNVVKLTDKLLSEKTEDILDIIIKLENSEINTVVQSRIIVDTISGMLIEMAEEEGSVIAINSTIKGYSFENWQEEIKKIILSAKELLVDSNGESQVSKLISGDENDMLLLIINIGENTTKINKIIDSEIIYETIKLQVKELGETESGAEKVIYIPTDIDTWTKAQWSEEIKAIIGACEVIIVEEVEGVKQVNLDKLKGDKDKLMLTISELSDSEVEKVLDSQILYLTLTTQVKKLAEEEGTVIALPEGIDTWNKAKWVEEVKAIVDGINILFVEEVAGIKQVNFNKLDSSDINKLLQTIVDLTEDTEVSGEVVEGELTLILKSDIIVTTIANQIKKQGTGESPLINTSGTTSFNINEWRVEIKSLIFACKHVLTGSDGTVDINNISSNINKLLTNVINLHNDPNGDNDELGKVLHSVIISDTIIKKIKEQSTENGGVLTISESIVWNDVYSGDTITQCGELRNLFSSIKALYKEDAIDIENIDINDLLQRIKNLVNKINDPTDEVKYILNSKIISETAIDKIIEESGEGKTLSCSYTKTSPQWYDQGIEGSKTPGELRNLFTALSTVYKDSNIDIANIDANDLLGKIKLLVNKINDPTDEIKLVLNSKVISETAIKTILNESGADKTLVCSYTSTSPLWYDQGIEGSKTPGELRKIFKTIPIIFADNVDISEINANIILELNDSEVDTVLESNVFYETIKTRIKELDGKNDVVVTDSALVDLNTEVKGLIKAANIILKDSEGNINLTNPSFDVEKILDLTDAEQNDVLLSQIIVDSISTKIKALASDDSSMLVVNENNITSWRVEIKKIISNAKLILKPDVNGKYLANPQVDYDKVYSMDDSKIANLVASDVIRDTITIALVSKDELETDIIVNSITSTVPGYNSMTKNQKDIVITNSSVWKDTDVNGEIHKALLAATRLIAEGEVDINRLKTISNDDLDIVFESQIILDTFYKKVEELSTGSDPVLFIKDDLVKDSNEAKRFVMSIREVIGSQDITNMNSSEFNFDKFISKSDSEIDTILASEIIRYSAAKKVYELVTAGGSLNDYIELSGSTENQKLDEISNDLGNMIRTMRDLKEKGISYDSLGYDTFLGYITDGYGTDLGTTDDDKIRRADFISDTLLHSTIISNSIEKMINKVLSQSLDNEMLDAVNTDMNSGSRNYWLDYDENANGAIEETEIGEFKKIFRMMVYIEQFTGENSMVNNSNISDKETLSKPLLAINNSKVLCGIIPMFVDKALENVRTWRYTETDPLYKATLTKDEWDEEIIVISTIIELVNNEASLTNLSSLDVKNEAFDINALKNLLKQIALSRILNIASIEDFVEQAVNTTFTLTSTVTPVYTGNVYADKVEAWNADGKEIDALINAINKLRSVDSDSLSFTDRTAITAVTTSYGTITKQGVMNAYVVGQFLDACKESIMLESVIEDVFNSLVLGTPLASYISYESISGSFTESLMTAATIATMF